MDLESPIDRDPEAARRFQTLNVACAALAASVLFYEGIAWFLLGPGGMTPPPGLPDAVPLSITAAAMVLILLSSRLRSVILRQAVPRNPVLRPDPRGVLEAYRRATLTSFALLEGAGLLGLVVALLSGRLLDGFVLCAAALLGMLTRWPRAGELDRILRGRLVP